MESQWPYKRVRAPSARPNSGGTDSRIERCVRSRSVFRSWRSTVVCCCHKLSFSFSAACLTCWASRLTDIDASADGGEGLKPKEFQVCSRASEHSRALFHQTHRPPADSPYHYHYAIHSLSLNRPSCCCCSAPHPQGRASRPSP